jgi:hypothetical protein
VLLWLAPLLFLLAALSAAEERQAGQKSKAPESYAVIAGTVFQSSGFLLRGAEVIVTPQPDAASRVKVKKQVTRTDNAGEFAVRVPAVPLRYSVSVKAVGFAGQEKEVEVAGEQRVEVLFHLDPERK